MKKQASRIIGVFLVCLWVGYMFHYMASQPEINRQIMADHEKHEYLKKRYQYEEDIIQKRDLIRIENISTDSRTSPYYTTECLVYALLMFNKHKKYDAGYYFYRDLMFSNISENGNEDLTSICLDYLNYGANNHSSECVYYLMMAYSTGRGVEKDSLKADSLKKVYYSLIQSER